MPKLLQLLVEEPRPCSYVSGKTASLEHRILVDVEPDELERMLERGWRRFGPDYFRPACSNCDGCVPTRVLVDTFRPTRSQRRAFRKLGGLSVRMGPPSLDEARLALYHAWHEEREVARGWDPSELDVRDYFLQFAFPHPAAREVIYVDEARARLVGVGICDETPNALSAVYFFYDPAYRHLSPGVGHIVTLAALARSLGKRYLYLGYRVSDCPSLRYKAAFAPQEVLCGRPSEDEEPAWTQGPPEEALR